MGLKRFPVAATLRCASGAGVWRVMERLGRRLTVLAYHRVVDFTDPGFDTYVANVSASPERFRSQMDHVASRFDVIDLEQLLLWLRGLGDLPPRPLLITFDDGYRDNFEQAYPILREKGLPAVLFVTTGFVGTDRTLYWDRLARGFHHTRQSRVSVAGWDLRWSDAQERARALNDLISNLKALSEEERKARVEETLARLRTPQPVAPPSPSLALDWGQIRQMIEGGIEIGAHTHTHPILSRLPAEQAESEIRTSLARIESELDRPVRSFAYTNGGGSDFGLEHEKMLAAAGIEAAFSLIPGPTSWGEARARPLAIRRIMVHHRDDAPRFEAKLAGLARLSDGRV